ncbi:MAG TPA: hypothetical protein VGD98_23330 [Ktedonobacteraceae bacterium]
MQEAELNERVEGLFANALARTHRRDALLELYHTLRRSWSKLAGIADPYEYINELERTFGQIISDSLKLRKDSQLTTADMEIVRLLNCQFTQLATEAGLC